LQVAWALQKGDRAALEVPSSAGRIQSLEADFNDKEHPSIEDRLPAMAKSGTWGILERNNVLLTFTTSASLSTPTTFGEDPFLLHATVVAKASSRAPL
jgi:hypothetical protein